jgi:uncharacterized repeat protein (TIGR01451 family)
MILAVLVPRIEVAVAQDDATPTPLGGNETPTSEPSPTPTGTAAPANLQLTVTAQLGADGDVDGDSVAEPGDTITYTIQIQNGGDAAVGPVEVTLLYDATFIGATTPRTPGGQLDAGVAAWVIEELRPGEAQTFVLDATLNRRFPSGRTLVQATAVARINATEVARSGPAPIEVSGPNVRIVDVAKELVTDTASNGRIDPGDTVRFTIAYSNTGGGPSQDMTIVADFPESLTTVIASYPNNAEITEDGRLIWLLGSVPAGTDRLTVEFAVTLVDVFPAGLTTYDVSLILRSGTTTIEQRTESITITGPSLLITPRVELVADSDADGLVDPGDTVQTTLQVANVGDEAATNVVVTLLYPTDQFETVLRGTGTDDPATGNVTWNLAELGSEEDQLLTFQTRVRVLPTGLGSLQISVTVSSSQTGLTRQDVVFPVDIPLATATPGAAATPSISETRPAQGQGILGSYGVAFLIGAFLIMSMLSIIYVASRVLPGTAEERAEIDTLEERTDHRRMVRELVEGIVLTAILFSVMILGLQNALDQDSVNSIIAGIVGYVAGRVASSR